METKANYVAVGAFVLACVIGFVVTVLWITGRQYNEEYDLYQAYFKGSVTGLGVGTSTRYNGIEVGHITELEFDENKPDTVIVTMQVRQMRNLKIRESAVASIESQGFAGAPFVEITGGDANSPVLEKHGDQRYPVIKTKPSTFAELQQSAPQVVAKLNAAASQLNKLLSDDNVRSISHILANLDETTQVIARRSADIDSAISNANKTMANFNKASEGFQSSLDQVDLTVRKYAKLADDADAFVTGDGLAQIADLVGEARRMVANLSELTDQLNRSPTKPLFGDRRKGYEPK